MRGGWFCAGWWPRAHGVPPARTVHYNQTNSKHFAFPASAVPEQLQGQMSVLRYFASYMEQHLMKVGAGTAAGWVTGMRFDPATWVALPGRRLWPGGALGAVPRWQGTADRCGTRGLRRPFSPREVTCRA